MLLQKKEKKSREALIQQHQKDKKEEAEADEKSPFKD